MTVNTDIIASNQIQVLSISFFCPDFQECDSDPCQNNGACRDEIDGYTCICSTLFIGDNCEIDLGKIRVMPVIITQCFKVGNLYPM